MTFARKIRAAAASFFLFLGGSFASAQLRETAPVSVHEAISVAPAVSISADLSLGSPVPLEVQKAAEIELTPDDAAPASRVGRDVVRPVALGPDTKNAILGLINRSIETLEISTHFLDDADYEAAIQNAAERGVRIRMLVSDPRYAAYSKSETRRFRQKISELGRGNNLAVLDYPNRHLQLGTSVPFPEFHAKMIVADGRRAYVGDSNLYHFDQNLGAGVVVDGPAAKEVLRFFLSAWADAGGKTGAPLPTAGASPLQLLTTRTSDRNARVSMISDIESADKSVVIMQYAMDDPHILSALQDLKRRKPQVEITVILGREYGDITLFGRRFNFPFNLYGYSRLKRNNLDARFASADTFVHGKAMVIDGRITHLGSADMVRRGLEGNLELNLRIEDEPLARYFSGIIRSGYAQGHEKSLSGLDYKVIDIARGLEEIAFSVFDWLQRPLQAKRLIKVKKEFVLKFARTAFQWLDRRIHPREYSPVDLSEFPGLDRLSGAIEDQFEILSRQELAVPRGGGVFLVAGHTLDRAETVKNIGPLLSFNGDVGPGIYLTNDPEAAYEYGILHGEKDRAGLIIYEAQIRKPLNLPTRRREYEKWLRKKSGEERRPFWELLPEFARENGYDSVIMDHFEGVGRSYLVVLDRSKVTPVRYYAAAQKKEMTWIEVLKTILHVWSHRRQGGILGGQWA